MNRKILFALLFICGACLSLCVIISWKIKVPTADTKAIQTAVVKSFSILQKSGVVFISKTRCASCHHSAMTSILAEEMTRKGIAGVDTTAPLRTVTMRNTLDRIGNPNLANQFIPARFLVPYVLLGLNAEKQAPNFTTDIAVDYVISQASSDGSFKAEYARVPLEMGDVHLTAFSIRAVQLYASPAKAPQVKQLVMRSKQWLENQQPTMQQELAFQLLGLQWCGSSKAAETAVARKLLAVQNKDGGWSQLPTMASDAYATGQALYALAESGGIDVKSEAYQNGINYLLRTQDSSGAWVVATRSNPIQRFINSDFPPYDDNQYISAAATNWAALALAEALPDKDGG